MNWKSWLPLVLAIVMGAVAAKIGWDMISRQHGPTGPRANMSHIVFAKADLPAGHELTAEDLRLGDVPPDAIPRTSFTALDQLSGRILNAPLVAGQPVLESALAPQGAGAGIQALVPNGMRATTIEINEVTGVAGMLTPGCRVDIITTVPVKADKTVARTIVENVPVVAVDDRPAGGQRAADAPPAQIKTVTLLLTPRDAEAIELAGINGRLRLTLRSNFDGTIAGSEGVTLAELAGGATDQSIRALVEATTTRPVEAQPVDVRPVALAVPATQPHAKAPPRQVQMIRGGEESWQVMELNKPRPGDWTGTDLDWLVPGEE